MTVKLIYLCLLKSTQSVQSNESQPVYDLVESNLNLMPPEDDGFLESLSSSTKTVLSITDFAPVSLLEVPAQTSKPVANSISVKENVNPRLASTWLIPQAKTGLTKPSSCFNSNVSRPSQGKKDPLIETAANICKVLEKTVENEQILKEKKKRK